MFLRDQADLTVNNVYFVALMSQVKQADCL